jgi:hypothetical protein
MGDILIIDALVAQPGQGRAVYDAYMAGYAPDARARGMRLRHALLAPPLELGREASNTLTFIWSVEGAPAWWKARLGASADPSVAQFWREIEPLIVSRERRSHAELAANV